MQRKTLYLPIIATLLLAIACNKPVEEVNEPVIISEPEPQVVVSTPVEVKNEGIGSVDDYASLLKERDHVSAGIEEEFSNAKKYAESEYLAYALSNNKYHTILKSWNTDFPDNKDITFTLCCYQTQFGKGSITGDPKNAGKIVEFKEVNGVKENDLLRDTIFYSVNSEGRSDAIFYLTIKANIDDSNGNIINAEIISWAVDDEHRANFEANKLDTCKEIHDDGVVVDYDYIWGKYSDHITTFEH